MPPEQPPLVIPVPGTGDDEMSSTVEVLEQTFVDLHKRSIHSGQRLQDSADNVAEQTRLGFLESKLVIGTREAEAMRNLGTSKLAEQILQQRSAKDQPSSN